MQICFFMIEAILKSTYNSDKELTIREIVSNVILSERGSVNFSLVLQTVLNDSFEEIESLPNSFAFCSVPYLS